MDDAGIESRYSWETQQIMPQSVLVGAPLMAFT
jgi:hypothetical protein